MKDFPLFAELVDKQHIFESVAKVTGTVDGIVKEAVAVQAHLLVEHQRFTDCAENEKQSRRHREGHEHLLALLRGLDLHCRTLELVD